MERTKDLTVFLQKSVKACFHLFKGFYVHDLSATVINAMDCHTNALAKWCIMIKF